MHRSIVGARIRQRRRALGLKQAELAQRIRISPSYMNLIELNKRRIAGSLLRRIADALSMPLEELDGVSERRLFETLSGLANHPSFRTLGAEVERASELIGRFPAWAKGLGELAQSEQEATLRVQLLSDRLSNDPYLSETLHRMLTRIAAVRSTTEILNEYADMSDERRDRFNRIVHEEIQSLSEVGEALTAYLDRAEDSERVLTPVDEVEAMFDARDKQFVEIETAAALLAPSLNDVHSASLRSKAKELAEERLGSVIDDLIEREPSIKTAAAAGRARRALLDYAVGAIVMPMDAFARHAADTKYDLELLADVFSAEFHAVCHRLTALPRAGSTPRFGYFCANAAGTIIEMMGLDGFTAQRYAAACPLWVLFSAQQSPETVIRQRVLFPSGERFVFVARARHVGPSGFGRPRNYRTDMLVMKEADAHQTVYAPEPSAIVEEVGPGCRICPRTMCQHRVEDPLSE
ncbi:MAG: short-chain fatty acyl-CoA regulator family protein [Pseudomonadota bacterium]